MTPSPDALYTVLACTTLASIGALAVAVLPMRDDELTESWLAWRTLVAMVRQGFPRVREARPVAAPRPETC